MSTLTHLCCLIVFLGIAVAVIAALTDRLIEHWRDADLQDRINRAKWPKRRS